MQKQKYEHTIDDASSGREGNLTPDMAMFFH